MESQGKKGRTRMGVWRFGEKNQRSGRAFNEERGGEGGVVGRLCVVV